MQFSIIKKISLTVAVLATTLFAADAQTSKYRVPAKHKEQHNNMIAGQSQIGKQIKVEDTQKFMNNMFPADEQEPEADIYTEGWNSKSVNPYQGVNVPDSKVINVSHFAMPVPGAVTSAYGYRPKFGRMHKGVDMRLKVGDTVRAAFSGKVRLTNFEKNGYGNYVIMRHDNGLETVYGHLSKFLVKPNQVVKAGDPIALGGNTGRSTGPHLHFETRYMGYAINPAGIFDFANHTVHTDTYTFTKTTYQNARNYSPNTQVAQKQKSSESNAVKTSTPKSSKETTTAQKETKKAEVKKNEVKKVETKKADLKKEEVKKAEPKKNEVKKAEPKKTDVKKEEKKASNYVVKKGDSIAKIAARHNTSVQAICKANNIKSGATLQPGQSLKIK